MAIKGVALNVNVLAWDTINNVGKAGDSANFTLKVIKDGTAGARHSGTAISEPDATNCPGVYCVPLDATDMTADSVTVAGKSSTANIVLIPTHVVTENGRLAGTLAAGTHNPQSGDAYAIVNSGTYGNSPIMTAIGGLNDFNPASDTVLLDATQGAVTFGQVTIVADKANEGALHIVNANADGEGIHAQGTAYGSVNQGNIAGQYNLGEGAPGYGQYNEATGANGAGQYNRAAVIGGSGQYNFGTSTGLVANNAGGAKVSPMWAEPGADADTLETLSDQLDAIDAVTAKLDTAMEADAAVYRFTSNALEEGAAGSGLTAQETRDAMKLAPTAGAPAAGSIDQELDDLITDVAATHTHAAGAETQATSATAVTTKLNGMLETDGAVSRFTANALEQAPSSTATVAISSTQAATVATGELALRTYHTFSQAITSTSAAALGTATKLWLAIKQSATDADATSVAFIEQAAGLTVLAGATYATTGNGSLVVTGNSGAWTITARLDEAATALLGAYEGRHLAAEVKALVSGDTVAIWDGTATISSGIVQAVS